MATKAKEKTVKVTGNASGHGFQIGEKITVTLNTGSGCGSGYYNGLSSSGMMYGIYKHDFVETPLTSDEIKKTIDTLQKVYQHGERNMQDSCAFKLEQVRVATEEDKKKYFWGN